MFHRTGEKKPISDSNYKWSTGKLRKRSSPRNMA